MSRISHCFPTCIWLRCTHPALLSEIRYGQRIIKRAHATATPEETIMLRHMAADASNSATNAATRSVGSSCSTQPDTGRRTSHPPDQREPLQTKTRTPVREEVTCFTSPRAPSPISPSPDYFGRTQAAPYSSTWCIQGRKAR